MFELWNKNKKNDKTIAFYIQYMVFWCHQIDQKNQRNFCKDFRPSLLKEVKSLHT